MKIGIVGMGVVGKAVYNGFSPAYPNITTYDICDLDTSVETLFDCDCIFICVPATAVDDAVSIIVNGSDREDIIFILKSTVVPGTTDRLQQVYGNNWVFCPEFLTERTANLDFINSSRFIIGGNDEIVINAVYDLYRKRFSVTPIFRTTLESAEFVKYMANLYFASKVTFMNEMYNAANELGVNWDDALGMVLADGRIAHSHCQVPGPDGKKGYGGKCFPENVETWLEFTDKYHINNEMIRSVDETNKIYRED